MAKRVSIAERNRVARLAPTVETEVAEVRPETSQAPATSRPAVTRGAPARAGITSTTRVGIYFRDDEFDRAKAAYLSDWQHGGEADTFARWIARAIDAHAARDTKARAQLERTQREGEGSGGSRSFTLPTDAVERMRKAIVADQQTNRWPTASAWSGDAIAAAVSAAEAAAGGSLPPAPARLPNRLSR